MESSPMALATVLLLALLTALSSAKPLLLVTSGRPKCLVVSVPEGTTLAVQYDAPDLVLDGPDSGPVSISVRLARPVASMRDYRAKDRRQQMERLKMAGVETVQLKEQQGSISYDVPMDGEVDVCIRASPASREHPMRFGIEITSEAMMNDDGDPQNNSGNKHLSNMDHTTRRLEGVLARILSEADYAKEREMVFHNQSIAMNAASMWWPILQLCILLVTGFTQVSHMVRFFKTRHII
eukprot:CAMPEP_0198298936 /NCGR_PEP_ID=MMETSP1449-20131203/42750_1 /TAXON_ID=420275 /ORGANISM="Attheya septentrionalis, Strain CCMP2084" /LENGTH=237 /DNA_ID=CAMNT_0044000337 /DNA_START=210 /DNA_END=923 /DNA_ORIENTATION=+